MKNKPLIPLIKMLSLFTVLFLSVFGFGQISSDVIQNNQIRIKFHPSEAKQLDRFEKSVQKTSADGIVVTGIESLDALNKTYQVKAITRVFPDAGKFEARHRKAGLHLWYKVVLEPSKGIDISRCVTDYKKEPSIDICEYSYKKVLYDATVKTIINDSANDPRLMEQWHYQNIGQTGGLPGADIQLFDAWKIEAGSSDVIVAIIDGGVDYTHDDLVDAMWINEAEYNGSVGVDDDGNGYIDDIHGYGFGDNIGEYYPGDHGTHVGGTIGAVNNNGIGVAGVAGGDGTNPGVRLMSCATFGLGNQDGFDLAFVYAADNGAVIAQNSWGYGEANVYEQSVLDAIDYFIAYAGYDSDGNPDGPMQGGLVIFAAGNDNSSSAYYPGYYESVLSVAATNHNNQKAWYSNYGTWVDVAAPGGETSILRQGILSTLPGNYYGFYQGTSMACPHVSGIAALIVSKYGGVGSGLTAEMVWDRLVLNIDEIDPYNSSYVGMLGSGKVNAFKALIENDSIPPSAISDLQVLDSNQHSVLLHWTATGFSADSGTASRYDMRYATFPITEANFESTNRASNISQPKTAGENETFVINNLSAETEYWFALKAADFFGNESSLSNVVSVSTKAAPIINVTPERLYISMDTAQETSLTAQIQNLGSLSLEFTIPEFLQVTQTVITASKAKYSYVPQQKGEADLNVGSPVLANSGNDGPDGFGYSWSDNKDGGGPQFKWIDISAYGTNATYGDDNYITVPLSFSFPFYGVEQSQVSISTNGFICFNSSNAYALSNQHLPYPDTPNNLISLLWDDLYAPNGAIKYFGDNEKFIVQFSNVNDLSSSSRRYTAEIILYPNGNILLQYLSTDYTSISKTIGIENATGTDGITVAFNTDYIQNGLAVLFSTKPGFIREVSPLDGTITAGNSQQINMLINSTDLEPDNYLDSLAIYSNDSLHPVTYLPIMLHVNGESQIAINPDSINFGNVFVTSRDSLPICISNPGTDSLLISSIYFENDRFELAEGIENMQLYKNDSALIWVYFSPVDNQVYNDSLVLVNNTENTEIKIPVTGTGLYPPVFACSPDSMAFELQVGDSVITQLIIDNTAGLSTLDYQIQIQPKSILKTSKKAPIGFYADETRTPTSFPEIKGSENQDATGDILDTYPGVPVGNTGVTIVGNYAFMVDYVNYRVVKYNLTTKSVENYFSVISYPSGIAYDGVNLWVGNESGNIYCYTMDGQNIGSLSTPFFSFLVITYNGTNLMVGQAFQNNSPFYTIDNAGTVIETFYSNLNDLFQFTAVSNASNAYYAVCNNNIYYVENEDNTIIIKDSVPFTAPTYRSIYSLFSDGTNLWVSNWDGPLYKLEVEASDWLFMESAGGSVAAGAADTLSVTIHTHDLIAGFYDKQLVIRSNDPNHSGTTIPVHLTMHGVPQLICYQDSIVFDSTFIGLSYQQHLELINVGTDTLFINSILSDNSVFEISDTAIAVLPSVAINVPILFTPIVAGTVSGNVTINSNDIMEPQKVVSLTGIAQTPPIAMLSVDSVFASLYSGESTSITATLTNTGGVQMFYSLDHEYIETQDSIEAKATGDLEFLSSSINNLTGIAQDPNTNIIYGAAINSNSFYGYNMENNSWDTLPSVPFYCVRTHALYFNHKIFIISNSQSQMGIYDIQTASWQTVNSPSNYNRSFVTDGQYIYFWEYNYIIKYNPENQTSTAIANFPYYNSSNGELVYYNGQLFIYFPYGTSIFYSFDLATNVWTQLPEMPIYSDYGAAVDTYSGKFYTTYSNMLQTFDFENQSWEMFALSGLSGINGGMLYCNDFGKHGIYMTSGYYGTDFLRYETETPLNWLNYESVNNTLQPNESTSIALNLNASHLSGGTYRANLKVKTNSLVEPETLLPVSIEVTDASNISLSTDSLFFENTYVGYSYIDSISITNAGSINLLINDIQFNNPAYTISANSMMLAPNEIAYLVISVQIKDTGFVESNIVLKNNAFPVGDRVLFVRAYGKKPPVLNLEAAELNAFAQPEETVSKDFVFSNTGASPLKVHVKGNTSAFFDSTSMVNYTYSGETTIHRFNNLSTTNDSLYLVVTLNGDYSSASYEYAELVIEGTNMGIINTVSISDGQDYVRTYAFDLQTANFWLQDGVLEVHIVNSYSVDPGYGQSLNQVQLKIDGISWFYLEDSNYELQVGESVHLETMFNAEGLEVGDYETSFALESNDPAQPSVEIPVQLKVMNQVAPIVKNPLSDEMYYLTENKVLVSIKNVFFDGNGDSLHYSVSSSNIESIFASIVGDTALQLMLLKTGASSITLSASDGYFNPVSTTFNVLVINNVGIVDYSGGVRFNIYPNPFKQAFVLDVSLKQSGSIKLDLLRVDGSLVTSIDMGYQTGNFEKQFDNWEQLNAGVYFMKLWFNDKLVGQEKLIKY